MPKSPDNDDDKDWEDDDDDDDDDWDEDDAHRILIIVLVVIICLLLLVGVIALFLYVKKRRAHAALKKELRVEYHPKNQEENVWIPRGRPRPSNPHDTPLRPEAGVAYPDEINSNDGEASVGSDRRMGPYAGDTLAHSWVPPIHKTEPPPAYRETDGEPLARDDMSNSLNASYSKY